MKSFLKKFFDFSKEEKKPALTVMFAGHRNAVCDFQGHDWKYLHAGHQKCLDCQRYIIKNEVYDNI